MEYPTIRLGSTGNVVEIWQAILGANPDGIFGNETTRLTRNWQTEHQLEPDGVVGPESWAVAHKELPAIEYSDVRHMSQFIPNKFTPLDPDSAAKAIAAGYKNVTGSLPGKEILALLIGQAALETGNWKSMHNFNFGNVRGEAPDGKWTSFRAGEIINGKEEFWDADSSASSKNKFRAFDNAIDGATNYVKILKSRPHWWAGLQTKTAEGFIKGLTTYPAYFTASPSLYLRVLNERTANYQALAVKYAGSAILATAIAAAAATAAFVGVKKYREG